MNKTIQIGGVDVPMTANGGTPRRYQQMFSKDLLKQMFDMARTKEVEPVLMEELAYTMAYTADNEIPPIEEWLEQFDSPLAIVNASKDIMVVWNGNQTTSTKARKKAVR